MRLVIQRSGKSSVSVGGKVTGRIDGGLVILAGVTHGDTAEDAVKLAEKCANLRIFEDDNGKMNLSLKDRGGAVLAVSQFTLYADASHSRRPSFSAAAPGETAEPVYNAFVEALRGLGIHTECGVFGADMKLNIENDGPVTIIMESK